LHFQVTILNPFENPLRAWCHEISFYVYHKHAFMSMRCLITKWWTYAINVSHVKLARG